MNVLSKREPLALFFGDLAVLAVSLWLSLFMRFGQMPETNILLNHIIPFSILSLIWTLSFFIAGLYETHRVIIRNRLPEILIKTQAINSVLAVAFFYFIPAFGIAPKTILSVYVIVSLVLIVVWRIAALYLFVSKQKCKAILIGSGVDAKMLFSDVNKISRHNFEFVSLIEPESLKSVDFQKEIIEKIYADKIEVVVADSTNSNIMPFLPHFYNLIFSKIQFLDFHKLYGEVFYKMPINALGYGWFIQNISVSKHAVYDALKRIMDIIISIPVLILSVPFVFVGAIALKIQDGGHVFGIQNRVGRFGRKVRLIKMRTMLFNDDGRWKEDGQKNEVTKVGSFLRKTRIDELPQIINVLRGEVSLIGPRPEFPEAVAEYSKAIPYYNARHIIKPGLSGWAQIYHDAHPHHGIDIEETKNKLSYDLYYIKNRSIVLDIMIALKTIKTFLSREGR